MRGARPGGATHPFGRTRAITPCRDPTAGAPTSDAACRSSRKRSLPFTAQVVHPREIAVLTRLAGGRDCRRQPPPWRHHHHPAFLVIRDATIKETIGALYKRLGEQVAPRYRSGEPARQIKDDVDIGAGLTARRNHGWAELHQFAGVLIQVEARRGVPPSQRRNTEVRLTHRWRERDFELLVPLREPWHLAVTKPAGGQPRLFVTLGSSQLAPRPLNVAKLRYFAGHP